MHQHAPETTSHDFPPPYVVSSSIVLLTILYHLPALSFSLDNAQSLPLTAPSPVQSHLRLTLGSALWHPTAIAVTDISPADLPPSAPTYFVTS